MGPVEAIRTCFAKYADFSGRAARPEYWWFTLFLGVVELALSFVDGALGFAGMASEASGLPVSVILRDLMSSPLATLFWLGTMPAYLAVSARRLHDVGRTGWWQLPFLILQFGWPLFFGEPMFDREGSTEAVYGLRIFLVAAGIGAALWFLWQFIRRGDPAPNRYGPPPNAPVEAAP